MAMRLRYEFKQAADALNIYLYSDVEPAYTDWWTGETHDEGSADHFRAQLDAYPNASRINLFVNSNGGDVKEGYGIYAQLKRHPAQKDAYVDGIAASIASVICCACDEVVMYRNSMMFIHNMACGVWGNAAELRREADTLDKMMEGTRQVYLAKAGDKLTEEQLIEMLDKETWLTAIEAQSFGLCDTIVDAAYEPHTPAQEQAMQRMFQLCKQQPPEPPKKERLFNFINI